MVVGKVARNTMSNQGHCSCTEHIALNRKRWQFPNPPGIGYTSLQCGSSHCTERCSVQKHCVEILQIFLKYHIVFFIIVHAIAYSYQSLVCAWITKHHPPWMVDWLTTQRRRRHFKSGQATANKDHSCMWKGRVSQDMASPRRAFPPAE